MKTRCLVIVPFLVCAFAAAQSTLTLTLIYGSNPDHWNRQSVEPFQQVWRIDGGIPGHDYTCSIVNGSLPPNFTVTAIGNFCVIQGPATQKPYPPIGLAEQIAKLYRTFQEWWKGL